MASHARERGVPMRRVETKIGGKLVTLRFRNPPHAPPVIPPGTYVVTDSKNTGHIVSERGMASGRPAGVYTTDCCRLNVPAGALAARETGWCALIPRQRYALG